MKYGDYGDHPMLYVYMAEVCWEDVTHKFSPDR